MSFYKKIDPFWVTVFCLLVVMFSLLFQHHFHQKELEKQCYDSCSLIHSNIVEYNSFGCFCEDESGNTTVLER